MLNQQEFKVAAAIDIEEAERMVKYVRRKDQLSRPMGDMSGSEVGGRSFSAALNALPDVNDFAVFGVSCRVRRICSFFLPQGSYSSQRWKEQEVVWRLLSKMQAKEILDVASVFYVPKSPGRVYFEARSIEAVRILCEGMVFLYFRSLVTVPVAERVALLNFGKSDPLIEEGAMVKVKDGLYRDDIANVVSVIGSHDTVVLKLRSWEKLPNVQRSKHKRGHTRRDPYLLTKEKAAALNKRALSKVCDDGFTFQGKLYTTDGHLLLQICCDRVERIPTGAAAHEIFVASELANAAEQTLRPQALEDHRQRRHRC